MANYDIVSFPLDGERILGVAVCCIEDEFIVYADYALYRVSNSEKTVTMVIENVIIPACDEALFEYRLEKQRNSIL